MKKLLSLIAVAVLMLTAFSFQSCQNEKYTVWTETARYVDFVDAFDMTLDDGYYRRIEISNNQWDRIAENLTSEGKHKWSESEIKNWLVGNGFGESEAEKESSWLVSVDHGFIVTRDGYSVYMILK